MGRSRAPLKKLVATYFGGLEDNLGLAAALPVDGLHIDLVREVPETLKPRRIEIAAARPAPEAIEAKAEAGAPTAA